jgi:tetratricopeptide (TPR) repeat protein
MHLGTAKSPADNRRLDSWKEIAAYLGHDERTAKRWEKTRGLPVRRLPGVRSGVFAFTSEIDIWQKQGSVASFSPAGVEAPPLEKDFPTEIAAADAAVPSLSPMPQQAILSSPGHLAFRYRGNRIAVQSLSLLALVCFLFLFAHRSGTRGVVSGSSTGRSGAAAHVPSKDVEDLYLSGRYSWNKRTPADLNTALNLFKQATQRDPSYASPYIGLADTYFLMVEFAALQPRYAYPPAIAAARRAIALDPSMPEAHRSLGFSSFYWNWDRLQSEREFRKAIEIDPHDATAHHWFANTLMTSQRYQDALSEIEIARKLDPTAISILADRGQILSLMGRKEEAREALLQIEKVDPSYLPVHWYLAGTYDHDKDDWGYLDELRQIAAITHREADSEVYRAAERGFSLGGEQGMSSALAETQLSLYRRRLVPAFDVASALARSGKGREAIQYLRLAYQSRDTQFLTLMGSDVFPTLKDDPEFKELAEKSKQLYQEPTEVANLVGLGKDHP